jgi:hypothetical protein
LRTVARDPIRIMVPTKTRPFEKSKSIVPPLCGRVLFFFRASAEI